MYHGNSLSSRRQLSQLSVLNTKLSLVSILKRQGGRKVPGQLPVTFRCLIVITYQHLLTVQVLPLMAAVGH